MVSWLLFSLATVVMAAMCFLAVASMGCMKSRRCLCRFLALSLHKKPTALGSVDQGSEWLLSLQSTSCPVWLLPFPVIVYFPVWHKEQNYFCFHSLKACNTLPSDSPFNPCWQVLMENTLFHSCLQYSRNSSLKISNHLHTLMLLHSLMFISVKSV